LQTRQGELKLSAQQIGEFVQAVVNELPSSSTTEQTPQVATFGELLIDMIWSVDADLEDEIFDAKAATATKAGEADGMAEYIAKAKEAQVAAESDRKVLAGLTKQLVVC
jgi:THO complex subunit 2